MYLYTRLFSSCIMLNFDFISAKLVSIMLYYSTGPITEFLNEFWDRFAYDDIYCDYRKEPYYSTPRGGGLYFDRLKGGSIFGTPENCTQKKIAPAAPKKRFWLFEKNFSFDPIIEPPLGGAIFGKASNLLY